MSGISRFFSAVLAFIIGFLTFPISFLSSENTTDFEIKTGGFSSEYMMFNGTESEIHVENASAIREEGVISFDKPVKIIFNDPFCDWFNYFGLAYASDSYLKGTIEYKTGVTEKTEEFFLEPCESVGSFYSFIDNCLENTKADAVYSITFGLLNSENAIIKIYGFSVFNRAVPEREVYIENSNYKLGVDLLWGGALSYLEDLNSDVEAVSVDGKIKVDSNASERYNAESVNSNVNLINRHDAGRLVQQSYYGIGSGEYEPGVFMGNVWAYNPVQGGNQYNDSSKIVDLKITESSIYVKCRPLDWAKSKECITPSYMEATYEFVNGTVHVSCRFIDFSGYDNTEARHQELPAFYCVEPLNNFVYYSGDNPWNNEELTIVKDLIFWPDAGYPTFNSCENWSAYIGEFDDSFGIGLFIPNETDFLTGVYNRGTTSDTDPSKDAATSYIALVKTMVLKNFEPFEYDFYLTTGNSSEIRSNFNSIRQK